MGMSLNAKHKAILFAVEAFLQSAHFHNLLYSPHIETLSFCLVRKAFYSNLYFCLVAVCTLSQSTYILQV